MKIKRILSAVATAILIITSLACLTLVIKSVTGNDPSLFGFRCFYIVTGSMEPEIPVESLIIVHRQPSYEINDVITFVSEDAAIKGRPNTHRIIAKRTDGGTVYYTTQGDANPIPDDGEVTVDRIYGKMVYKSGRAEWIGLFVSFLVTPAGFMTIIGIPLVIIAGSAMKDYLKILRANAAMQNQPASQTGEDTDGKDCPGNKENDEKEER